MVQTTLLSPLISLNSCAITVIGSPILKYFFQLTASGAMMAHLCRSPSTPFTVMKSP